MNVYDAANDLAKALSESDEYKRFKDAEEKLKENEAHFEMAQDFAKKQMEVQTKQMMGQELSEDEVAAYNSLTATVLGVPNVAEYFQTQMYFGVIFQDVMDIISKAVNLDLGMYDKNDTDEGSENNNEEEA